MTVHYLNRGTRYHIGNDNYSNSVDREFIDAYPVVGQAWAQPFAVSHDDVIEIVIENLWGVDYDNNNRVFINDVDIGVIGGEHNRGSWSSPEAHRVRKGQTYLIKIASFGPGDPDDFVFQGVIVKTRSKAKVSSKGRAKILHSPTEDYWTSDYDTGKSKSVGALSQISSQSIGQVCIRSESFPTDDVRGYWDKDYFITFLTYSADTWIVVMTKGGPYKNQRWHTRKEFPKKEIDKAWDEDLEITQLTRGQGKFAVVLSGPRRSSSQVYAINDKFPKKTIKRQWKDGLNIASLEYCYGGWALIMVEEIENRQQQWFITPDFPEDDIVKSWDEGYVITDITYGQGWKVIMTKNRMGQRYSTSSDFPRSQIEKYWNEGYKISSITHGDGRWVVAMDKE